MSHRYTVKAWSRFNISTRYEGRNVWRALYEAWSAKRDGFRLVIVEVE